MLMIRIIHAFWSYPTPVIVTARLCWQKHPRDVEQMLVLMLGQCQIRWTSIKPAMGQCFVFSHVSRKLVGAKTLYLIMTLAWVALLSHASRDRDSALYSQANTTRWPNVGLMLGQRRRRWANISPTVGQRVCWDDANTVNEGVVILIYRHHVVLVVDKALRNISNCCIY